MRILEYFFPDRELNLQTLRGIAKDIVNGTLTMPTPQQTPPSHEQPPNDDEESPQEAEAVVESVNDLHEPLGSFMKDSQGRFREYSHSYDPRVLLTLRGYIGAHSEIPFNAAVCSIGEEKRGDSSIIGPPKIGAYPPALPTPSPSVDSATPSDLHYLPPRDACDYYISKFLEDVHSTHWFYSIETFLAQVDNTYADPSAVSNSSWMCSLYAIFAIGASAFTEEGNEAQIALLPQDDKTANDYIAFAKQLIPAVYDEADIDSIRALAILVRYPSLQYFQMLIFSRA